MLSLSRDELHLWLVFPDENASLPYQRYAAVVSADEQERSRRFYFARDCQLFLLGRILVRTTLSQYVAVPPSAWRFVYNAFGRPEIANPECEVPLRFNISHTRGLVAVAITNGRAIGVDAEETATREFPRDVGIKYFAANEASDIRGASISVARQRLFEYWTLKEAYAKARGLGLSLPLNRSCFSFESTADGSGSIGFETVDHTEDQAWCFWQLWPSDKHLVALCAGRAGLRAAPLSVRVGLPDFGELTTLTLGQSICQHSSPCAMLARSIGAAPWRFRSSIT